MTVAKEPGHRGEREISRKPSRGECRAFSGVTVVTNARAFYTTRAAAGASGARHSLRPLISEGRTIRVKLAQACGEIAKLRLQMMLFEIDPVGWAKGDLAPCPPSIGNLILNGGTPPTSKARPGGGA
jgi:hypothetical protein